MILQTPRDICTISRELDTFLFFSSLISIFCNRFDLYIWRNRATTFDTDVPHDLARARHAIICELCKKMPRRHRRKTRGAYSTDRPRREEISTRQRWQKKHDFALSRSIKPAASANPLFYILVCSVSMFVRLASDVPRAIKSAIITHGVNHRWNCVVTRCWLDRIFCKLCAEMEWSSV